MRLYRMLETIDSCPAPVVCCVHGYALGGGSGLVACADIAVAWPDAVFGFTEVRLGIIPAVISPFVLAKIGSAARRYFVTGERFGAGRRAADRARVGGLGGRRRARRGDRPRHPRRRADRRPRGEAARARAAERRRHRAHRRRAANERRGTGRPARVPRAAPARLARGRG